MAMIRGNPEKMQALATEIYRGLTESMDKMEEVRGKFAAVVNSGDWGDTDGKAALGRINGVMNAMTGYETAALAVAREVAAKATAYRGGR